MQLIYFFINNIIQVFSDLKSLDLLVLENGYSYRVFFALFIAFMFLVLVHGIIKREYRRVILTAFSIFFVFGMKSVYDYSVLEFKYDFLAKSDLENLCEAAKGVNFTEFRKLDSFYKSSKISEVTYKVNFKSQYMENIWKAVSMVGFEDKYQMLLKGLNEIGLSDFKSESLANLLKSK